MFVKRVLSIGPMEVETNEMLSASRIPGHGTATVLTHVPMNACITEDIPADNITTYVTFRPIPQ